MKVKLLGPITGLVVGLGVAIGCGGSSDSEVTSGTGSDAGSDGSSTTPPTTPPTNPPPPPGPTDGGNDGSVNVPGNPVSVQYGNCNTFTPCGGNPVGTWTYASGGCLGAFDLSGCPNAQLSNTDIKVKGQVTFTGTATAGTVNRIAQVALSATAFLPGSCTKNAPCNLVELGLKAAPPTGAGMDSATCAAKNNGCECQIGKTTVDNGSETYTAAGNVITTGSGNTARTYNFCVNPANTLTYEETTASSQAPKATLVMTK